MARPSRTILTVLLGLAAIAILTSICILLVVMRGNPQFAFTDDLETLEITTYTPPPDDDGLLRDDVLDDKTPEFDPTVIDRRPDRGWVLNASAAVIRLDVPAIKPDVEPRLLVLYPSYVQAIKDAPAKVLPSINLIDGKAKQFDDGLYAALDQAYFAGKGDALPSLLAMLKRLREKIDKRSPAADYLAAGISLAGDSANLAEPARRLANAFLADQVKSKPIAFYTWTPALSACFRVLRFFAEPIRDPAVSGEIARVLKDDPALLAKYRKALGFYAKLSNPLVGLSPADLIGNESPGSQASLSLFPPSSSRETQLFNRLFPLGVPEDANLMRTLIKAIRSGTVDLQPRKNSGWYDYQVYALETLLLPGRGEEASRLLLTKGYKRRMFEAFQALITKRRETHSLLEKTAEAPTMFVRPEELGSLTPRLRVEPCPSYFLRTARSYGFLADFLESTLGEPTLKSLHGLRETGPREKDLFAELQFMRSLFYGLYLLSAEDIGQKPTLLPDEPVDRADCEKTAANWLANFKTDADLAADSRVAAPVYYDSRNGTTRVWMTLGVRLAHLDARYARAPRIRPEKLGGNWEEFDSGKLVPAEYLIPVDEFAEVELQAGRVLDRAELRTVCDRFKTKAAITKALLHR